MINWSLFTKNIRPHAQLRLKLQQKVNKLEKHLEKFPSDAISLKVTLERHPKKYWFTASLTLRLPSGNLRASKFGDDPLPAFDQAVRALMRELAGMKSSAPRRAKVLQAGKAPLSVVAAAAAGRAGRSARARA